MNNFDISVTVAAVIEVEQRFLMVEEKINDRVVISQPAGHLEDDESLTAAVRREVLEETGLNFKPTQLVGIYRFRQNEVPRTWLRFVFTGDVVGNTTPSPIDDAILLARWMSESDIREANISLRSPQVLRSLEDYLAGQRAPLSLIGELES